MTSCRSWLLHETLRGPIVLTFDMTFYAAAPETTLVGETIGKAATLPEATSIEETAEKAASATLTSTSDATDSGMFV